MSTEIKNLEQIAQVSYSDNGSDPLFSRLYTEPGKDVYGMFEYERRVAEIINEHRQVIFRQENVEVPKDWSQTATNIVASKYFRRKDVKPEYGGNSDGGEQSAKQLIHRVSHTLRSWGEQGKYFFSKEEADTFEDELTYLLLSQKAAFNSPVWFNLGLYHDYGIVEKTDEPSYVWDLETNSVKEIFDSYSHPQCSACFINSIEDKLLGPHSILELVRTEGKLFKYGSGSGTNWSPVRGEEESLSGGGSSSGAPSFMGILDANAKAIKSGGKTRRAAKMVILNADHPDVEQFIYWKVDGERKARTLAAAGYDPDFNKLYRGIEGQNSNNSIRVKDEFMHAALNEKNWDLIARTTGQPIKTLDAKNLLWYLAKAAWVSGDPGMQFDTTINHWHTCSNTAPINASNPCSEYMFIDDSACNLASLNLIKFREPDCNFNMEKYIHAIGILISAQEIIVDNAGYPTSDIAKNSHDYRPLGLGYANLGAFLMSDGIPYDSEEGFAVAAALTSILTGEAYKQSAKIASRIGAFHGFEKNREPFLRVMKQHHDHHNKIKRISSKTNLEQLLETGNQIWTEGRELISQYGARNSQATVLAPTGTIGFMMDCDTTGVEPDIALVKYKKLAGGGLLKLVNNIVPMALAKIGYNEDQIKAIKDHIHQTDTIEGAPYMRKEDLPVFDCAFKPANGVRAITPMGHVRMMAATQPFISGAISKTVNMPEEWTPKDVYNIYVDAWKLGLKAIAIYRDHAKLSQPLFLREANNLESKLKRGEERSLPQKTNSITIRVKIKDSHEVEHGLHIICGEYDDGTLGEVRAQMFEEGSSFQGMLDSLTTSWSKEIRYGAPVKELVARNKKFKFDPSGVSNYQFIREFPSLPNLIWRIVGLEYLGVEGYIEATGEEYMRERIRDSSKLRINQNKDRLLWEYYFEQIKEIDRVMNMPFDREEIKQELVVQVINNGEEEQTYQKQFTVKSNGDFCPKCGSGVKLKGGCTHCWNCGEQVGGGCPS